MVIFLLTEMRWYIHITHCLSCMGIIGDKSTMYLSSDFVDNIFLTICLSKEGMLSIIALKFCLRHGMSRIIEKKVLRQCRMSDLKIWC